MPEHNPVILPIAAIIATRNRHVLLRETLLSLFMQTHLPAHVIIVDASEQSDTEDMLKGLSWGDVLLNYRRSTIAGAAAQRNEGLALAPPDVHVLFMDDDIELDQACIRGLWTALSTDRFVGIAVSMIKNQRYQQPGLASRWMFKVMNGKAERSYAGKCIGPAINLLPEDSETLPEVVPVEWANTTCTLYRRHALPVPAFPPNFKGYSLMEDLYLSLTIAKDWKLVNARTARIYHNSQGGVHKQNFFRLSRMQLVNRHFIMTHVLGRSGLKDLAKLALWQCFGLLTLFTGLSRIRMVPVYVAANLSGVVQLLKGKGVE
ncbi:MAG: glycosyltransferase [Cyclobacteriaceae bacterium]|nr:glycosyltransferase [Cyclobacteriaceae bacterium]